MNEFSRIRRLRAGSRLIPGGLSNFDFNSVSDQLDEHDKENSLGSPIELQHYFFVGEEALALVIEALSLAGGLKPRSILDFPSGSGRITRWLRAYFPHSELFASDLYQGHLDFCSSFFGARPIPAQDKLGSFSFPYKFDLIFCGSLLTHLPESEFRATIELLSRSLNPGGVAVLTTHGRYSEYVQMRGQKYMPDEDFAVALPGYRAAGFGFAPYQPAFNEDKFPENSSYGISLSTPSYVLQCLQTDSSITVLGLRERGWDSHQDVFFLMKKDIDR